MKRILIILTAFYLIINACTNSNNIGSDDTGYPPIDTVKLAAIDTIMYHYGREWKPGPHFHKIGISDRDTIEYTEFNGEAQRISSKFYTDSIFTWTTFHQVNNELVLVRVRQLKSHPQSHVLEAISYLENGKIFYSKQRTKILLEGDQIGSFREEPFMENTRPAEQLIAEYAPYWELSKKAIEKDQLSRK